MLVTSLLVLLAMLVGWRLLTSPSHDRQWSTDQSVLPSVAWQGDSVTIDGVRNFHWTSDTEFTPAWERRTYQLDQVATAWYILAPFATSWRGPAHGFVSFGFDDGRFLSISVEARREAGEHYGPVTGLLRRFELIYVIGDERDLVGRRAFFSPNDVYLYPVRASRAGVRAMLEGMLIRADTLRSRPEFYNTLTNNCTSNLVRHVNDIAPGRIPSSWRIALPGYSDEVAERLGLIDTTLTLAQARLRFRINDKARAAMDSPEFSARIRD